MSEIIRPSRLIAKSAAKPSKPDVSIIVVSYGTREMTLACLKAVTRSVRNVSYEVLVIDNASGDGSAQAIARQFPQVTVFAESINHGFAKANNLAAQQALGRYLLLLNPDTEVFDNSIDSLIQFADETPHARIWGGRTYFADGRLNPSSCWGRMTLWSIFCSAFGLTWAFPKSEFFNPEGMGGWQRDSKRQVDMVSGCFLLIDRSLWTELAGFDPTYFMYAEEADLCARARKLDAKPCICPDAMLVHHGGASERSRPEKRVRLLAGKVTLMRSHWSRSSFRAGVVLLIAGCFLRKVAYQLANWVRSSASDRIGLEEWKTVLRERRRWMEGYPATSSQQTGR